MSVFCSTDPSYARVHGPWPVPSLANCSHVFELAVSRQAACIRSSPESWCLGAARPAEIPFLHTFVTLFLNRVAIECMKSMASSCPSLANLNMPSWRHRQRCPFLRFGQHQCVCVCDSGIVASVPSMASWSSTPVSRSRLRHSPSLQVDI